MRDSDLVSLFEEPRSSSRGVSAFLVSSVAHGIGLGLLSYGLVHGPRIEDPIVTERYSVRHLELHTPPSSSQDVAEVSGGSATKINAQEESSPDGHESFQLQLPAGATGQQTLVQPNFHVHAALALKTPVPTVMIWTPELASTRQIVAPSPEKPSASASKPSLDAPNEELNLGDLSVASTKADSRTTAISPGTTSPVSMHTADILQMAPVTTSVSTSQPTPTAVLSLSDVRMKDGAVILPPVNEFKSDAAKTSRASGPGQHRATDDDAKTLLAAAKLNPPRTGQGSTRNAPSATPATAEPDTDGVTHIALSPSGHFGVVVVGDSLSEEYPEMLPIWGNRIAYTAYLHVGLSKNWILEYTQTKSADAQSAGTVARLEAPWPYDIFRPNLVSRDLNADALMVHGMVNESGHFESLAIAFPAQYARTAFVLHALQQWQFRPARQNGKPVPVEILLIIPEELN